MSAAVEPGLSPLDAARATVRAATATADALEEKVTNLRPRVAELAKECEGAVPFGVRDRLQNMRGELADLERKAAEARDLRERFANRVAYLEEHGGRPAMAHPVIAQLQDLRVPLAAEWRERQRLHGAAVDAETAAREQFARYPNNHNREVWTKGSEAVLVEGVKLADLVGRLAGIDEHLADAPRIAREIAAYDAREVERVQAAQSTAEWNARILAIIGELELACSMSGRQLRIELPGICVAIAKRCNVYPGDLSRDLKYR